MNAMVEFVSGRCRNEMFCAVASAGDVVRVPAGSRFVCSYCGNKLVEVAGPRRQIGVRAGAFIGGGMGLAGLCLFAIGAMIGEPAQPPAPGAAPTTAGNAAPLHAAVSAPSAAPAKIEAQASPAVQAEAAPARDAQAVPAPPVQVQAAEIPASVIVAMAEPVHMLAAPDQQTAAQLSSRTGRLVIAPPPPVRPAIAEMPVRKVAPAPLVDSQAMPPKNVAQPAVAAAAPRTRPAAGNLEEAVEALHAPPGAAPAAQTEADALNDAEARKTAPAPPAPVVATAPTGPTRGFVPRALTGGAPAYPAAYEMDGSGRNGRVTVDCRIDTNGAPSGCRVVSSSGGSRFGSSVLNWLGSGQVRFAPILRNGQATAETHQWSINFQP
jgi:TonB family protein